MKLIPLLVGLVLIHANWCSTSTGAVNAQHSPLSPSFHRSMSLPNQHDDLQFLQRLQKKQTYYESLIRLKEDAILRTTSRTIRQSPSRIELLEKRLSGPLENFKQAFSRFAKTVGNTLSASFKRTGSMKSTAGVGPEPVDAMERKQAREAVTQAERNMDQFVQNNFLGKKIMWVPKFENGQLTEGQPLWIPRVRTAATPKLQPIDENANMVQESTV